MDRVKSRFNESELCTQPRSSICLSSARAAPVYPRALSLFFQGNGDYREILASGRARILTLEINNGGDVGANSERPLMARRVRSRVIARYFGLHRRGSSEGTATRFERGFPKVLFNIATYVRWEFVMLEIVGRYGEKARAEQKNDAIESALAALIYLGKLEIASAASFWIREYGLDWEKSKLSLQRHSTLRQSQRVIIETGS